MLYQNEVFVCAGVLGRGESGAIPTVQPWQVPDDHDDGPRPAAGHEEP